MTAGLCLLSCNKFFLLVSSFFLIEYFKCNLMYHLSFYSFWICVKLWKALFTPRLLSKIILCAKDTLAWWWPWGSRSGKMRAAEKACRGGLKKREDSGADDSYGTSTMTSGGSITGPISSLPSPVQFHQLQHIPPNTLGFPDWKWMPTFHSMGKVYTFSEQSSYWEHSLISRRSSSPSWQVTRMSEQATPSIMCTVALVVPVHCQWVGRPPKTLLLDTSGGRRSPPFSYKRASLANPKHALVLLWKVPMPAATNTQLLKGCR